MQDMQISTPTNNSEEQSDGKNFYISDTVW